MVDSRVIKIRVVNDYINILQRNYFWLFFISLSVGFFGVAPFKKLKYMLIQNCTFLYVDSKTISFDIDVVYSKIPNKQKRENIVRHVFGSRNIQNVFV